MKVLIAGATGFVGRHLAEHLRAGGERVYGWGRTWEETAAGPDDSQVDLLSAAALPAPPAGGFDAAFVLAAESRPAFVTDAPTAERNVAMVRRVLTYLASHAPGARTVVMSSGHVYGPKDSPLNESDALAPNHPYAASKLASEACALEYAEDLSVTILRPFNQIGPGMAPGLLIPDLLERLRTTEGPVAMRGQDATRAFLDIRDAVRAYDVLLRKDLPSGSIFNLCSGRPTRVSSLVQALMDALGMRREVTFAEPGTSTLVGSPARLQAATGWRAELSIEASAERLVRWIQDIPNG